MSMHINLFNMVSGAVVETQVSATTDLETLKTLIEVEFSITSSSQKLICNGKEITASNDTTLQSCGIESGSMITVLSQDNYNNMMQDNQESTNTSRNANNQRRRINIPAPVRQMFDFSNMQVTADMRAIQMKPNAPPPDPINFLVELQLEKIIEQCRSDASILSVLRNSNEELGSLVHQLLNSNSSEDASPIRTRIKEILKLQFEHINNERNEELRLMNIIKENPDGEEAQKLLEEQINKKHVQENFLLAQDQFPESFGHINMLYINMNINGNEIKAFVDTGAQSTIMSKACAERCNLMRLVDTRFEGTAQGVGQDKIMGRIHMAQIKIGAYFYPASFTVLENNKLDFLFGLDMLKRHQCVIDLKQNQLHIGANTVAFLPDSEVQKLFGAPKDNEHKDTTNSKI